MRVEHIAIWVSDLEGMRRFYEQYFGATSGPKYENPSKDFESYFLTIGAGTRLELMRRRPMKQEPGVRGECAGFAHLALSVGSKETVDELTETLRRDGFTIADNPRLTGDGYYESVVLDPEGNRVEITV